MQIDNSFSDSQRNSCNTFQTQIYKAHPTSKSTAYVIFAICFKQIRKAHPGGAGAGAASHPRGQGSQEAFRGVRQPVSGGQDAGGTHTGERMQDINK